MSDFSKILKNIPPEYKKQKKINGNVRGTYFFWGWTGYNHPIHMTNPASYAETQKPEENNGPYAYYEASLDTTGKEPLLVFVEKLVIKREPVTIDEKQLNKGKLGDSYYLFQTFKERVMLTKEVNLDDTFNVKEYVHIVLDESGKVSKSELVLKTFFFSYEYEYDEKGIKKVTVRYPDDIKVIERGQPQVF